MTNIIGQNELVKEIDSYTLDTLPHSMMFIGDRGCGKHTLCHHISEKFNLQYVDLSDNISSDIIDDLYSIAIPNIIVIDLSKSYIREQNIILKFLEEPPKFSFISVLCVNDSTIIETINNRCTKFRFSSYSKEDLSNLIPSDNKYRDIILKLSTTPGNIIDYLNCDLDKIYQYVSSVVDNFEFASYGKILEISNHIAYKGEQDKFPIIPFINSLLYACREACINSFEPSKLILYKNVCNISQALYNNSVDEKNIVDRYLLLARKEIT